jgi:hypothetical protein
MVTVGNAVTFIFAQLFEKAMFCPLVSHLQPFGPAPGVHQPTLWPADKRLIQSTWLSSLIFHRCKSHDS